MMNLRRNLVLISMLMMGTIGVCKANLLDLDSKDQEKLKVVMLRKCASTAYYNHFYNPTHHDNDTIKEISLVYGGEIEFTIEKVMQRQKQVETILKKHDPIWLQACFRVIESEFFNGAYYKGRNVELEMLKYAHGLNKKKAEFSIMVLEEFKKIRANFDE